MAEKIAIKFGRELNSFFSLTVINVVFSGMAMGISLSFAIVNALAVVDMVMKGTIFTFSSVIAMWPPSQVFLAFLGIVAAGLSMKWMISSAEILSEIDEIKQDYADESGKLDSDGLTSLIVKTIAYYRGKKKAIKRLGLFSRIGGICFLANAALAINGALTPSAGFGAIGLALVLTSILLNIAIGIAGIIIPHFFSKYSATWEYRLNESAKAEQDFKKMVEGA
jgi:hypothetical protein